MTSLGPETRASVRCISVDKSQGRGLSMVSKHRNPCLPVSKRWGSSPCVGPRLEGGAGEQTLRLRRRWAETWPAATTVGVHRAPRVLRRLFMTEPTVVPEYAAPAEGKEAARHAFPAGVDEARFRLPLVPRRGPAHAVCVHAHVILRHQRLVMLLAPDRRHQARRGGGRAVANLWTDVRHYLAVQPSHGT